MTSLEKSYPNAKFDYEVLRSAVTALDQLIEVEEVGRLGTPNVARNVKYGGEHWSYGTDEEFAADYRKAGSTAYLIYSQVLETVVDSFAISLTWNGHETDVTVRARTRADVLKVIGLFDAKVKEATLPPPAVRPPQPQRPRVFIGHGRASDWQTLLIELQKHDIDVLAFETGARAGHTIRDVLMNERIDLAVLVLTAEDEQGDGELRARQNVVHEVGLFQGRLGWDRAIMLIEQGTEQFSNVDGIVYIEFARGQIKSAVSEVLAVLKREKLV